MLESCVLFCLSCNGNSNLPVFWIWFKGLRVDKFRQNGRQGGGACAPCACVCLCVCVCECVRQPVIRGVGSGANLLAVEARVEERIEKTAKFLHLKEKIHKSHVWLEFPFFPLVHHWNLGVYLPWWKVQWKRSTAVPQCRNISPFIFFLPLTFPNSLHQQEWHSASAGLCVRVCGFRCERAHLIVLFSTQQQTGPSGGLKVQVGLSGV